MKCPLELIDEFSEWLNTCQECSHYKECMNTSYLNDTENTTKLNLPLGDNFPTSFININNMIKKDRTEMIEKLLIENMGKITQDDIDDIEIDVGLYNKNCRKQKIKRQYKKRIKKE